MPVLGADDGVYPDSDPGSVPATDATEPIEARTLIMYCTPWCPDCARARRWLKEAGIAFIEVDVSRDGDARSRAAAYNDGRLHTPTFELGADTCIDFRPERLRDLLGL